MRGVKLLRKLKEARLPTKATRGSAYYDLYAAEGCELPQGSTWTVTTGWMIEVPAKSLLDIRSRSGMSSIGLWVANAPGTVDEDYRGELKVILHNATGEHYVVKVGDRIAQCALMPVWPTSFREVRKLSKTRRGEGGYGSTGR